MSANEPPIRVAEDSPTRANLSSPVGGFPGILRQKITIPESEPSHVHRAQLIDRVNPTRRRLTLLKAAGGFGKTTVLAECCRRLRKEGIAVAWVSVDEGDEPAALQAYIAFACAEAGLNLGEVSSANAAPCGAQNRIESLVRRIQSFDRPVVIVFDELERLRHRASVALVDFLLQRGPPHLHLAAACREIPDGFNAAEALLDGRADVIGCEELRFSKADTARFFGLSLTGDALAKEMERSAGWPLALRMSTTAGNAERQEGDRIAGRLIGNWMESRLFRDLERGDRDFLLDLGLFGRIDADLLHKVLQGDEPIRRLESMAVLDGLLEVADADTSASWQLHPLLREHCVKRRFREDPERFRTIHRRIARVLAMRGETVPAMRHAVECGDPVLAGEILEKAGGVRLWTRHGVVQLREATRMLSDNIVLERPRLGLARSMALALAGRHREARALYRECRADRYDEGDNREFEYFIDDCIVRGGMALYGTDRVGSAWLRSLPREIARFSESPRMDPHTRGHLEYAQCVLSFQKGDFDTALDRLDVAADFLGGTRYIALYGEMVRGQIDFARGCVAAAKSHFQKARYLADRYLPDDPVAAAAWKVAEQELAFECNPDSVAIKLPGLRSGLTSHAVPFSFFATACNVLINTRLRAGRSEQALADANELLGYVRGAGLTTFARIVAALRASVLVGRGRAADAERAWLTDALPQDASECVDLSAQSWREMEAVSEARLRLLVARGRFDKGRALLADVRSVAADKEIRKIEMRAVANSIMLEHAAGDLKASQRRLREYLALYCETPYAWAVVREGAVCADVLSRFIATNADSACTSAARSLLAMLRRVEDAADASISAREREVLRLLPENRVREIADSLGISVHGVRYHLRKLFTKLGVSNRAELLDRASALGLIPDHV